MASQKIINIRRQKQLDRIEAKLDALLELLAAKPKRKAKAKPVDAGVVVDVKTVKTNKAGVQ